MKKRSKTLSLGGHKIRLVYRSMQDFEDEEDMLVDGFWSPATQSITLREGITGSQAQDTLIHECIHAIDDTYMLGLKHKDVHVIATGLQQLLAPWLKKV